MGPEVLAVFIPIIFLVGLFAVIAMNIFFKFKTKSLITDRVESVDEWHKIVKAEARAARKHGVVLRICGLLIGLGLGIAIGCIILASSNIDNDAISTFLVISFAIMFSGLGMVGAYFLERKFDDNCK